MDQPISSNLPHGIRMRANNLQFYEQVFNSNSKPKSVYELVQVLHDTKRAAGMDPKGWIIGEAVLEQLKKEYEHAVGFNVFCYVPPQIMGLQFFVDTETPNRLELIS